MYKGETYLQRIHDVDANILSLRERHTIIRKEKEKTYCRKKEIRQGKSETPSNTRPEDSEKRLMKR